MKKFMEEYGNIVVSIIVIMLLVVAATPIGNSLSGGIFSTQEVLSEDLREKLNMEGEENLNQLVNLFSFENADEHFSSLAPSYASSNYIMKTSDEYGYKDTENGYFVYNASPSGRHGITGAMEPLSAGTYKLTAEVYIPSGNTDKTKIKFEVSSFPDVLDQGNTYDIKEQDKWVKLETTFVVKEGNTAYVQPAKPYISTYPVYTRNIKVTEVTPKSAVDLRGYKWTAIGDSLTQKSEYSLLNYHDYVAFETGIEVVNMGTGGAGFKAYENKTAAFYQKALNISADTDVVTIFGSGNDLADSTWNTYTLGTPSDTGTDTICGAINTAIDNIYATNPNVKLGIILPTPWGKYNETLNSDPGNRMTLYVEALVEICEARDIPYLDLYTNSVLKPWDPAMVEAAFNTSAATHPNEYGHSLIAPQIQEFVVSLLSE